MQKISNLLNVLSVHIMWLTIAKMQKISKSENLLIQSYNPGLSEGFALAHFMHKTLFSVSCVGRSCVTFVGGDSARAFLFAVSNDIVRLAICPVRPFASEEKTYTVSPGGRPENVEGIMRGQWNDLFLEGGGAEARLLALDLEESVVFETKNVRVKVSLRGLFCSWYQRLQDDSWVLISSDRATRHVEIDRGRCIRYYQALLDENERFFGLGETSGERLNKAGRRIRLKNSDALGYCAASSHPLYKNIPFFILSNNQSSSGCFFDTMSDSTFDFGLERSNYHGRYRYVETDDEWIDMYMIAGDFV